MAIYHPNQRLDYLYINNLDRTFLRVTVRVPIDINEYILAPLPADINSTNLLDIQVILRVFGHRSDVDIQHHESSFVIDIDVIGPFASELPVRTAIGTKLAALGSNEFKVTTTVSKDSKDAGKVTNTISQQGEIEMN